VSSALVVTAARDEASLGNVANLPSHVSPENFRSGLSSRSSLAADAMRDADYGSRSLSARKYVSARREIVVRESSDAGGDPGSAGAADG
jgi:hypothetical protein